MEIPSAIDRTIELLDSSKLETVNTSMRIPNALIGEAATLAVDELGAAIDDSCSPPLRCGRRWRLW